MKMRKKPDISELYTNQISICKRVEKLLPNLIVKFSKTRHHSWQHGYISLNGSYIGKIIFYNNQYYGLKLYIDNQYLIYTIPWMIKHNIIVKKEFFEKIVENAKYIADMKFKLKVIEREKLQKKKRKNLVKLVKPNYENFIKLPEQYKGLIK